jgi:hypothetical protein
MEIRYRITLEDFQAAQALALSKHRNRRLRMAQRLPIVIGLVIVAAMLNALVMNPRSLFDLRLIPASCFAILFLSSPLLAKRQQRKLYERSENLHGDLAATFDREGVSLAGSTFNSRIAWAHFFGYLDDARSVLLFSNEQVFHIIPKRALNDEQLNALSAFLAPSVRKLS